MDIIKQHPANHDGIYAHELALTGYPPEDLLFRHEFQQAVVDGVQQIQAIT